MKLVIVPAREGATWVKLGLRTFFRQPLAFTGLFLIFVALISLLSAIPWIGNILGLALMPPVTLGFFVASRQAVQGKFPMPSVLFSGFRAGPQQARNMATLGAMYAGAVILALAVSALADEGAFARVYLLGGNLDAATLQSPEFQTAALLAMTVYLPVSMMFWHAPALMQWHNLSATKSLFFSLVACWRNIGAFTVYTMVWFGVFMAVAMLVALIGIVMGSEEAVNIALFPILLVTAAAFFSSMLFSFEASFDAAEVVLV
jgi:hypothetical protein